jgi:hypothetical protein
MKRGALSGSIHAVHCKPMMWLRGEDCTKWEIQIRVRQSRCAHHAVLGSSGFRDRAAHVGERLLRNPLGGTSQCRGNQQMEMKQFPYPYDVAVDREMQASGPVLLKKIFSFSRFVPCNDALAPRS